MSVTDDTNSEPVVQPDEPVTQEEQGSGEVWTRDRRKDVLECPLGPGSLCGSYFQKIENDEVTWQGVIVAEPQPGQYLLELLDWHGKPLYQRLVALERMVAGDLEDVEWRFFDSETWAMRSALAVPGDRS